MTNGIESHAIHAGQAALEVEMVCGESTAISTVASSPMKLLTPVARGKSVWAYTSSFGGGLVAGDATELRVNIGRQARCFVSTQASTKVYRNPSRRPCSHTTRVNLAEGGLLVFAPDPVQAFAGSYYRQRQSFYLANGAGLVMVDWFTSGRAARGERWAFTRYESRNDVWIDGKRVLADPLLLRSPDVEHHMGRFDCMATLLLIGAPLKAAVEAMGIALAGQPVEKRAAQVFCVSLIPQGLLLRMAGMEVENIRHVLQHHLGFVAEMLGDNPWARKW
jgi:urease accessory protein